MNVNKDSSWVVGLTGGIASGKTAASDYLKTLGAVIIDADVVSRQLTAAQGEALPAIRDAFGAQCFREDGTLDRRRMGEIVFTDLARRRALESILHPMIQRRMLVQIDEAREKGAPIIVLSVPLLFECGMDALCDETWVMALEPEEQLSRLMERDLLTREQAEARIRSQMPLEEKIQRANVVIHTNRPIEQTRQELAARFRDVLKRRG